MAGLAPAWALHTGDVMQPGEDKNGREFNFEATPFDQLWCRVQFRRFGYQGQYTPPGLGTRIAYPAFDGVMDWYGASVDPARQVLIANTSYIPFIAEGITEQKALRSGLMQPWAGWESNQPYPKPKEFAVGPQYGTPYLEVVRPWLSPLGAPYNAPPWGKLVAIDLQSRKISWERPVGTDPGYEHFQDPY